jgi:hypothetical protein
MAVAIIVDMDATLEEYDAVNAKIDPVASPPDGLIVHVGTVTDSGIRAIDVWESEEAFNDFRDNRLGPAIGEVMGERATEPNVQVLEVHDLVQP